MSSINVLRGSKLRSDCVDVRPLVKTVLEGVNAGEGVLVALSALTFDLLNPMFTLDAWVDAVSRDEVDGICLGII